MVRTLVSLVFAAALAASVMPSAEAAAHFAAWTSAGYAVGADNNVYAISIQFHGTCTNTVSVDVRTLAGALVEHKDFRGFETLADMPSFANVEAFQVSLGSQDGTVVFNGQGWQRWYTDGSQMWQVLTGHFRGYTYAVETLGDAWNHVFCN